MRRFPAAHDGAGIRADVQLEPGAGVHRGDSERELHRRQQRDAHLHCQRCEREQDHHEATFLKGNAMLRGAAICAIVLVLASGGAVAQKVEGEIASLVGKGEYRRSQQTSWTPARVKQGLFALDWVQTLDMSRMVLRFGDGSTVHLGPNNEFQVIKVATPSDPGTILQINRGRAWSQSKTSPGGLQIRTGSALAAVRGTD